MKNNKYNYLNVIQQNYGFGWEDVSEYEANSSGMSTEPAHLVKWASGEIKSDPIRTESLLKHDLREYRLTGYATRVIFRKELIVAQVA